MDKSKLRKIPDSPGVYIFKGLNRKILYIGKARSLKKRIRSYFTTQESAKIKALVSKISDVEYIIAANEIQARIKEAELIKRNLPPYNTVFRDDKSFPLLCISDEEFPVVWIARRTSKRLQCQLPYCVGPYPDAGLLRKALKSIRQIFGFRSCTKMHKKPCLYYRLKLCPAPCAGKISAKKYQQIIKNIKLFLAGKQKHLINRLTIRMQKLSRLKRFEEAAVVKNQIKVLSSVSESASLADFPQGAEELEQVLGLGFPPQRIEAFDVSNISGCSACACLVSFDRGNPDKNNYRRFRIKTVTDIDDYRMLQEAIQRRYRRLVEEKSPLPDLIVIDGGKGHVNIAKRKLQELGLNLAVIGIAKPKKSRGKERDRVFVFNRPNPVKFRPNSDALRLIQTIRDEAHRFALAYHKVLRKKKMLNGQV